ncbi:hypothetical protein [Acinetobacter bouvetii]|uniref:Uncharacterized protein n=1 Tax=Acinetobacter bouvetii TaxID=202951 RepID=A0A811GCF1_9GAMM|nr:hypothetical protein [Acinetobacter bouvetii]CAB1216195.1 hypothetical protein SFB21_1911 [Acinetobacter bouvetii]
MKKIILATIAALVLVLGMTKMSYAMTTLDDESLSDVTGQALFSLVKETDSTQGLDFFKLGLQAELSLNTNIKSLQLGCGGDNGAGGCDIDISNLSFGCVTGSSGSCITLGSTQDTVANQTALKDFVLTNPFFQFAIKGGSSAATRQVVGVRLGAEKAEGPMSIGTLNSFSGYLTGVTNLNILAQNRIAVTCQAGTIGCAAADQSKYSTDFLGDYGLFGHDYKQQYAATGFLGVKDAEITNLGLIAVRYRDLTINTAAASKSANVTANGTRLTQVSISNLGLGDIVNNVVEGLEIDQLCAGDPGDKCNAIGTAGIAGTLMPLLKTGIKNYMKEQTLIGLGQAVPTQGALETDSKYGDKLTTLLNNYNLPYNLSNVHQLEVSSSNFGIALTSLLGGIQYPGYAAKVGRGWSMYLEKAFTLDITDSLTNLMSNMVQNGQAAAGNITTLAPAYRNCFGSLNFC